MSSKEKVAERKGRRTAIDNPVDLMRVPGGYLEQTIRNEPEDNPSGNAHGQLNMLPYGFMKLHVYLSSLGKTQFEWL